MRRGTTPTITINVTGEDFFEDTVYVTLEQDSFQLTKSGEDVVITPTANGSTVAIFLSQKETLMFKKGSARIQIRWIDSSGIALASPIKSIAIDSILLEGVISYA